MAKSYNITQVEAAHRKRTMVSALLIFLAMPLTIFVGLQFGKSKFMVVSIILLIYTMLPFFMVFEKRKPKAREIVLIAMMSALTVALQLFCHITLPLQIGHFVRTGSWISHRRGGQVCVQFLYGAGTVAAMADVLLGDSGVPCGSGV